MYISKNLARILIWITVQLYINLRDRYLKILILPIHEHGIFIYLDVNFFYLCFIFFSIQTLHIFYYIYT